MARDSRDIDDLTLAFLDGDTIDWTTAVSESPGAARLVRQLQVVAAVADAQRNDATATVDSQPRPSPAPLESWGHLRLVDHVGHGAFGDVYRAWDTRLDREVALKLIPAASAGNFAAASSIIREGRLLARVRHSSVVTIHGADQIGELVGLWMEFVSGRTLGHGYPYLLPGSRVAIFRARGRVWQESALIAYSFDTARRVAIVRNETDKGENVAVYSVETSDRRQVAESGSSTQYTSEGQLVYLEGSTLIARQFDPSRLDVTGPRVRMLSDVWTFSVSHAGSLLYRSRPASTPNSWLVWVNRDGSFERVAGLPPEISHARICPADPRRLVFERYEHIWTFNSATGALNRLTSMYSNRGPVWTPSCDRIFFSARRKDPVLDVISIAADGTGNETVIAEAGAQHHVDVARNGKWLAYETISGIGRKRPLRDVWLRELSSDAAARPLSRERESRSDPALSPDGRWVAYASGETGRYEVYVRAVDAPGKRRLSFDGGREPVWNPNGQEIFYRQGDQVLAVNVRTAAGRLEIGNTTVLFEGPYMPAGVSSRSYDVASDGNRFLMVRREAPQPRPAPVITIVTNWVQDLTRRASAPTAD